MLIKFIIKNSFLLCCFPSFQFHESELYVSFNIENNTIFDLCMWHRLAHWLITHSLIRQNERVRWQFVEQVCFACTLYRICCTTNERPSTDTIVIEEQLSWKWTYKKSFPCQTSVKLKSEGEIKFSPPFTSLNWLTDDSLYVSTPGQWWRKTFFS